jgi:hypothetical protein
LLRAQFLLTSLQKFNQKSAFLLKQTSTIACLFRHMNMNMKMKMTRTKLVVEFKEFQRLPEWPIVIKLADRQGSSDQQKPRSGAAAPACSQQQFRSQAFAE